MSKTIITPKPSETDLNDDEGGKKLNSINDTGENLKNNHSDFKLDELSRGPDTANGSVATPEGGRRRGLKKCKATPNPVLI